MKPLAAIALAFTLNAHGAITPVVDTLRGRSDGWERDMRFVVDELAVRGHVRLAVTGCAQRRGYIAIVEINDEDVEPVVFEWAAGDGEFGSDAARIICEGE